MIITTRFHGPTDTLGSRIVASSDRRRVTVPWNYALSAADNHLVAAEVLSFRRLGARDVVSSEHVGRGMWRHEVSS